MVRYFFLVLLFFFTLQCLPAQHTLDVIVTKAGRIYKGKIVDRERNVAYTIRTMDGEFMYIYETDIAEIRTENSAIPVPETPRQIKNVEQRKSIDSISVPMVMYMITPGAHFVGYGGSDPTGGTTNSYYSERASGVGYGIGGSGIVGVKLGKSTYACVLGGYYVGNALASGDFGEDVTFSGSEPVSMGYYSVGLGATIYAMKSWLTVSAHKIWIDQTYDYSSSRSFTSSLDGWSLQSLYSIPLTNVLGFTAGGDLFYLNGGFGYRAMVGLSISNVLKSIEDL